MNGIVYVLAHPVTLDVRYVGGTTQLLPRRLGQHIYEITRKNPRDTPLADWVRELHSQGLRPTIHPLETRLRTQERIDELEFWWIGHLRELGWDLLNVEPGGKTGYRISPETMAKSRPRMSAAQQARRAKGKETRAPHSVETREKMKVAQLARRERERSQKANKS